MLRLGVLRLGLGTLAVLHLLWGVPAILAPQWFFNNFPGLGRRWTAAYPPYNEHLMVDVGAAATTLGVLLALAAYFADRRTTAVVLTGLIVFSTLHLGYHLLRHGTISGADLVFSLGSLTFDVAAPAVLLTLNAARPGQDTRR